MCDVGVGWKVEKMRIQAWTKFHDSIKYVEVTLLKKARIEADNF